MHEALVIQRTHDGKRDNLSLDQAVTIFQLDNNKIYHNYFFLLVNKHWKRYISIIS